MVHKIMHIWKNFSIAKKASIAMIFAKFLQKGLSMISTPIFTRIMDTEQYGILSTFASWQNIIVIIATLNLSLGVFNNGMMEFEKERDSFSASLLILANLCTAVCIFIYLLFYKLLSPVIGLSNHLMVIMFLYMLFFPAYSYWSSRQRYEYKYKLLTIVTILISGLQIISGVIAVYLADTANQAAARIYVNELLIVGAGIISYLFIFIKAKAQIRLKYIKYAFRFNIFLVPHFLALNILTSADKIMISSMVSAEKTAIYAVSYSAASIILIFWQAIEASWTPWLFEHLKAGNCKKQIQKRCNQILTMFAFITLLCIIFAPEIMKLLATSTYYEGIYIIPSVTTGVYFSAVYALYMRLEYYSEKTKPSMIGSILAAGLNLLLNYIFIPTFGYIAAGYTTLICYVALAIFHYAYIHTLKLNTIYDNRYIWKLSFLVLIIACFINLIYPYTLVRYFLISLLIITSFIKKDKIISIIKDIF